MAFYDAVIDMKILPSASYFQLIIESLLSTAMLLRSADQCLSFSLENLKCFCMCNCEVRF